MTKSIFTPNALEGETVVITGASRGIGAAIFEACLKAGATVIGTATSESGAEKITAKAKELALVQINQSKADIIHQVAGGAGLGELVTALQAADRAQKLEAAV